MDLPTPLQLRISNTFHGFSPVLMSFSLTIPPRNVHIHVYTFAHDSDGQEVHVRPEVWLRLIACQTTPLRSVAAAVAHRWRGQNRKRWTLDRIVDSNDDEFQNPAETVWGALEVAPICILMKGPTWKKAGSSNRSIFLSFVPQTDELQQVSTPTTPLSGFPALGCEAVLRQSLDELEQVDKPDSRFTTSQKKPPQDESNPPAVGHLNTPPETPTEKVFRSGEILRPDDDDLYRFISNALTPSGTTDFDSIKIPSMPDIDAAFENECSSPYVYRSTPPVTGITSARTSVASRVRFNAESPCKRPRRQAIQKRVTNRKADVEDEPQLPPLPKLSFPSYVATDKLVIHKRVSKEQQRRRPREKEKEIQGPPVSQEEPVKKQMAKQYEKQQEKHTPEEHPGPSAEPSAKQSTPEPTTNFTDEVQILPSYKTDHLKAPKIPEWSLGLTPIQIRGKRNWRGTTTSPVRVAPWRRAQKPVTVGNGHHRSDQWDSDYQAEVELNLRLAKQEARRQKIACEAERAHHPIPGIRPLELDSDEESSSEEGTVEYDKDDHVNGEQDETRERCSESHNEILQVSSASDASSSTTSKPVSPREEDRQPSPPLVEDTIIRRTLEATASSAQSEVPPLLFIPESQPKKPSRSGNQSKKDAHQGENPKSFRKNRRSTTDEDREVASAQNSLPSEAQQEASSTESGHQEKERTRREKSKHTTPDSDVVTATRTANSPAVSADIVSSTQEEPRKKKRRHSQLEDSEPSSKKRPKIRHR